MANIQVTNSSSVASEYIDIDKGDRFNRVAKWVFAPSEVKSIGEEEIVVSEDFQLPDALRSGHLTVTEADLDSLSDLQKKNFLASGLDLIYETTNSIIANKRVVANDSTNNKVKFVATQGDKPYGVTRQDGTSGQSVRVKTAGSAVVVCGASVTSGDKLVADTTGRVRSSTTPGNWQIGLAPSDGTTNQELTITVDIKQIV